MQDLARAATGRRAVLRPPTIIGAIVAVGMLTAIFMILRPVLPGNWTEPGSPELYLTGVLGAALLLTPFAFWIAKRSGRAEKPPSWFVAHVLASIAGLGLILIHSAGSLISPPGLLIVAAFFLVVQGFWARSWLPRRISGTFGSRYAPFTRPSDLDRAKLASIIEEKRAVLEHIDPSASEATFSLLPGHWLRSPLAACRYQSLVNAERAMIGQRRTVPAYQAYWRLIHMLVAFGFLAGVLVHVVTVTFFAGYVADGGPINWWHLADWGG